MKILWLPHTAWHIPQRAHIFCRPLSERHEVHVTDWVADFIHPRDYLSSRYVRNFFPRTYRDDNILVHGVPRITPALISPLLRQINQRVFERLIHRIISTWNIDVVVGTFVVPPPIARRVVFDLFDDNIAYGMINFKWNRRYIAEIELTEKAYLEKSDVVVASSHVLVDTAIQRGTHKPVVLIPNGVELAEYDNLDRSLWRARLGIQGHLVAVLGNHDKEIEVNRVLELARLLADKDFQFIFAGRGSALPAAKKRAKTSGLSNVHFIGPLDRKEIPSFLAGMEMGLCPYQRTAGADAAIPMRLLQYAAAGLPTVCPDLTEVRKLGFPNVLLVEEEDQAFAEGLLGAAQMPIARPRRISEYDLPALVDKYEAVLRG